MTGHTAKTTEPRTGSNNCSLPIADALVSGVAGPFYDKIIALIPHNKRIVLDLTDLAFVDSMGLGTLVRLYVSAKSAGSCLQLINLGKQIRELLGITHLLGLFGDMCEKGVSLKF